MREVFVAVDGKEFFTEAETLKHEKRLDKLAAIDDAMKPLGELPKDPGCRFANGHGYIQRDLAIVAACCDRLLRLFGETYPSEQEHVLDCLRNGPFRCRHGIIGRIIDDSDPDFWRAWSRLGCIDDRGREWGQAYYALNPARGDQVEWKEPRP